MVSRDEISRLLIALVSKNGSPFTVPGRLCYSGFCAVVWGDGIVDGDSASPVLGNSGTALAMRSGLGALLV